MQGVIKITQKTKQRECANIMKISRTISSRQVVDVVIG